MSSIQLISDITASFEDAEDRVRFTVGRFEALPGTPNTVPSSVVFTIDLRHPDDQRLNEIEQIIHQQVAQVEKCTVEVRSLILSPSINFDEGLVQSVESNARNLGYAVQVLPSGATHDAASMARLCPTAMIFVPCRGGESHNENEWAEAEHLWAGACVLADTINCLGDARQC
jgi:N-carbamoyl-L-amino-acid hydrolase